MQYAIICLSAFLASGLTLFSGFGLGTLLLPVFAVFFPLDLAIALTAVVHLFNNLFKLALLGKYADKTAVGRFGLPAVLAALLGARTLFWLSHLNPLLDYRLWRKEFHVLPVKLVVALLMVTFALTEFMPRFEKVSFDKKYLPLGGILSGFFGGLSGLQGALRSPFLIKCGLSKESFIATGVVIACLVDVPRIFVYSAHLSLANLGVNGLLLLAATLAAFSGAFLGNLLIKKVTMRFIQVLVAIMLLGIALALGSGII